MNDLMLQTLSVSPGVTFHSYREDASADDIQGALLGLIVTCANTQKYAELVVFASEERWRALMVRVQRALFEDSQDFLPVDVKENTIRYTHARGMEGVRPRQIEIYGDRRAAELRGICGDACVAWCREQPGTPPIYFPSRQVLYDVILPWRQFRQEGAAQEAPLYLLLPKDRADMAKTRGQLRAEAQPALLVNEYLWDRSPLAREMLQREQEEALNRIEIQRIMAEDAEQQSKVLKPDGRAASYTPRVGTADGDGGEEGAPKVPYEPSDIADIARIIRPTKAKMRIGEKEEAELLAAVAKQARDARLESLHGAVRAMLDEEDEEELR